MEKWEEKKQKTPPAARSSAEPAVPDARMGQASSAQAMQVLTPLTASSPQHCCLSLAGTYWALGLPKQIQRFMKKE